TTGPALCGWVIAAADVASVYAVQAGLIAASLAALALMGTRRRAAAGGVVSLAAIREGLAFVRRNPVVLGCMTLDMFAVIFGGAAALLPIYATDILRVGPRGYGLLTSSLELGALVMSLALTILPPIRRAGVALLAAVSVYGLTTIVFGLSRWRSAARCCPSSGAIGPTARPRGRRVDARGRAVLTALSWSA